VARGKITSVRGVRDILPEEARRWWEVERTARDVFARYGYGEIRVPLFERTDLFARSIGEETEIVNKEMYTFDDKGGESITLRPEATASICRAYVQHALYNRPGVVKLFCIGPMFRYERPQAGRLRQFHQIDAEAFGSEDPAVDAEVIAMLMDFLGALGLEGLSLEINNLGDPQCRPAYAEALRAYLRREAGGLGPEARERIERNPLRAKLVTDLKDYPWSSYAFYAYGTDHALVDEDPYYASLGSTAYRRQDAYREFVSLESPYASILDTQLLDEPF